MCWPLRGGTDWLLFKRTQRFDTQQAAEKQNKPAVNVTVAWCKNNCGWPKNGKASCGSFSVSNHRNHSVQISSANSVRLANSSAGAKVP